MGILRRQELFRVHRSPYPYLFPSNVIMYALATDHLLYYKITPEPDGFKLRLWETATGAGDSQDGYLYIINYRVTSMAAAKAVLTNHLTFNGSALPCNQAELPYKGKIRLLAFPTWNGCEAD
jgi:hypothetical protein